MSLLTQLWNSHTPIDVCCVDKLNYNTLDVGLNNSGNDTDDAKWLSRVGARDVGEREDTNKDYNNDRIIVKDNETLLQFVWWAFRVFLDPDRVYKGPWHCLSSPTPSLLSKDISDKNNPP